MTNTTQNIAQKWNELKQAQPQLRIRNAAIELGVSEAELLATQVGENVTRLTDNYRDILSEIESLGYVMALTRNDDVVHERKGVYLNAELDNDHVGLFVGDDIDLRIFLKPWGFAFAVVEMAKDKPRYSLQFFAKDGEAIHKIYLTEKSNVDSFNNIVAKFKSDNQTQSIDVVTIPDSTFNVPDEEIDIKAFQSDWVNLKDTHHFFGMLMKYKLNRTQALRLAPEGNYAVKVSNDTLRRIFTDVAQREIPIMVFVGNKGMIQIHTGTVKKLVDMNEWFNVLDPEFNMHLKESAIHESWVVRKPTEDGVVTALECFDKNGVQIVQIFGKRKPGIPEIEDWRKVVAENEK
jgi:putative hemin transport protein